MILYLNNPKSQQPIGNWYVQLRKKKKKIIALGPYKYRDRLPQSLVFDRRLSSQIETRGLVVSDRKMKNIIRLLSSSFTILLISSSASADNEDYEIKIKPILIKDETNSILIDVNLEDDNSNSNCRILVEIIDPDVIAIADGAFADLGITELLIENGYRELNLRENSFRGLAQLQTLKINTPITSANYKQLFEPISGLKHLGLSISNNTEVLEETLPVLEQLTSLFIFDYRSWKIDNETFANAAQSITNLTFFGNEIELIGKNSFSSMEELKVLEFQFSAVDRIESGAFDNLKLDSLDFTQTELGKIERGAFSGLDVEYLRLWNNKSMEIENGAFENSTIGHLILGPGGITSVDDDTRSGWGISNSTEIFINV